MSGWDELKGSPTEKVEDLYNAYPGGYFPEVVMQQMGKNPQKKM